MYITNLRELEDNFEIGVVIEKYEEWNGNDRKQICCPFHEEKTPSFSIHKGKNLARCFGGCGTFYPISFVQEKEGCSFIEAVEKCAAIHGLTVEYDTKRSPEQQEQAKKKLEKKEAMYQQNALAAQAYFDASYKEELKDDDSILFKVGKSTRTLKGSTVKKFKVCHTPSGWNFLESKGLEDKLLVDLGLVKQRKDSIGFYDSYRNRQLFPISVKVRGTAKIVGFGARRLEEKKDIPKYLNSPESIIYDKSNVLYGLQEQERTLRKNKVAYLVEGYWDVLTAYNEGLEGFIASSGTAVTKKHVLLLKRFIDHIVLLLDSDKAGLKAARKALPLFLEEGIKVDIVLLPEGEDPDSYIRKNGVGAFNIYCSSKKDALIWAIEDAIEGKKNDVFAVSEVCEMAVNLIQKIEKETVQELYTKKIAKILGIKEQTLIMELREKQGEKRHSRDYEDLTDAQQKSLYRYSTYEFDNEYFVKRSKGDGYVAISNFIVNPLFLLDSPTDPKRLFEIVNKYGQKKLIDIEGTALIELSSFKRTVEPRGNFIFFGNTTQYDRLKRKIYDLMTTCYEITVLGYHRDGFYTFGNGIFTVDKNFIPVNEYGVLEYKDKQYFLPAFSDIYRETEESFSDEKNFIYQPSTISFEKWAKLFCDVHGDHGKVALCFYIAALFRSSIKDLVKFPILNLFGQPQSGKSLLLENLSAMFGKVNKAFNLNSGTDVGFSNKLITVRDGLIMLEEYKNDISKHKVEGMKGIYDDVGRERGQKTKSRNIKTLIHSTAVIAGQELPTVDIALFTRCISLAFSNVNYSQGEKDLAEELISMRQGGQLSSITAQLSTFRPLIVDNFQRVYNEQFSELKTIGKVQSVSSRMIENNAVLLTIFEILKDKIKFPFEIGEIFKVCADNMLRQSEQISNQNEVSAFWDILEFLAVSGLIQQGIDYKMDVKSNVGKRMFKEPKQLLYLSFTRPFALYQEHHKRQHGKAGLPKSSMLHYLKTHKAFEGKVSNTRFGKGRSTSAYVFDYKVLGVAFAYNENNTLDTVAVVNNL